jgi:hypothetical protein
VVGPAAVTRPTPARPRLPDWPERMNAALTEACGIPFAWGTHDCWLAAAAIACAVTGRDPAAAVRGAYHTEEEAEARLARAGGLEALVAEAMAAFGAPECDPAFAQRGDVVLVEAGNQLMAGVVADARIAVPGAEGMQLLRLGRARRAWAI